MKTPNFTNLLWSVLALSLVVVRAADTYRSAARPGNESKPNTAELLRTGRRPAAAASSSSYSSASSRRFTSPRSAGAPQAVRQVAQRPNLQPGSSNDPDVSVTCSASDFVLRVKPTFYGLFASKEELKLGDSCESNGVLQPYGDLLFTYPLKACGAVPQSAPHHVAYKFVLHYEPSVTSLPKVDVDVECRYPRNYHVSKLIVQPTWKTAVMHKRLKGLSKNFHIELMDDSWSKPARSRVYQLGSQIHFQVSAFYLPHGAKVYISSCFATPASGAGSSQKYIIIDNSGCLLDSKRVPGVSQFISQTDNTLRFSLQAFQFVPEPEIALKIQCQLLVTFEDPGPAHKSCTYRGNGWEALSGDDSICECCDSQCVTSKRRRALMKGSATSQLLMVSDQPSMTEEGISSITSTFSSISRDAGSAISHYINNLQSQDNQGGADLDLYGKYDEEDHDGRYDSRRNLDIDKQSDMGELLAENNKSAVTGAVLFKDTGSGYSLDEDASKGEEEEEEFDGKNDDISQPEQVQKQNWKEIDEILTDIYQIRKQRDSEQVEEIREREKEDGNGRMLNSEVKLRNGKELDEEGLRTWYFW